MTSECKRLAEFLTIVYEQHQAWTRYKLADDLLLRRFKRSQNTDVIDVFEKCALLDRLYGANVYNIHQLATHIVTQRIDGLLQSGDLSVIAKIATGHKIKAKKGKAKNFYSFATKYASWHRPEIYPIFDNLIKRLVPKVNAKFAFWNHRLVQHDLFDYPILVEAVDSLLVATSLEDFRYKKIDKALWLWGKNKFYPKRVDPKIRKAVREAERLCKIRL